MFTFVCFVRCAKHGPPGVPMLVRVMVLRHDQRVLSSLSGRMWDADDRLGLFHLLQGCDVDAEVAAAACARAREVEWNDLRTVG